MAANSGTPRAIGWSGVALAIAFWLPALSGVLSRLRKHSNWFGDYGAVACAAEKLNQNAPIYDMHPSCAGVNAVVYVYHPAVAQAFSWPLAQLGQQHMAWAYGALFALAVAALVWIMIGANTAAPRAKRSWFAAFITGSAIYWGNLGVIVHALIGTVALALRKRPALLVLAIALGAVVKPLFLTFIAVFALAPWPLWRRASYGVAALALGSAPTALFVATGGALADEWRALLAHFVYIDRPGDGFFGWLSLAGISLGAPGVAALYLAFAGVVTLAGMIIAAKAELDAQTRVLLGLSLGVLLLPRLMSQDFWLLGPGLAALAATLSARSWFGVWLERALLALCALALVGAMADFSDIANKAAIAGLVLALLATAAWTLQAQRAPIAAAVAANEA